MVRIQATGWPSTTRSPRTASQRTRIPSNGVRTSLTDRPTRSPTARSEPGSAPCPLPGAAVASASAVLSRAARVDVGLEDSGRGAHHHPFGRVEVLALVDRVERRLIGAGHRVHQSVEVGGDSDGDGPTSGWFAAPCRSARRPGPTSATRWLPGPPSVSRDCRHRTGLQSWAESRPGHRSDRCAPGRRRWPPPVLRAGGTRRLRAPGAGGPRAGSMSGV